MGVACDMMPSLTERLVLCAVACNATGILVCEFVNPSRLLVTGILIATEITARNEPACIHRAFCRSSFHMVDTVGTANELPCSISSLRIVVGNYTVVFPEKELGYILFVAYHHLDIVSIAYTINCNGNKCPC